MEATTNIIGVIEKIMPVQKISDKFEKREIVVNTGGDYPQLICIQFVNDQCYIFESINEGSNVDVSVNIRGRAWQSPSGETKYFNTIQGWRIDVMDASLTKPSYTPSAESEEKKAQVMADLKKTVSETRHKKGNIEKRFEDDAIDAMTEDDDLPF